MGPPWRRKCMALCGSLDCAPNVATPMPCKIVATTAAQFDSTSGAQVPLAFDPNVPPVALTATVEPIGTVQPTMGVVTLRGIVECSEPLGVFVFLDAVQTAGPAVVAAGSGALFVECDGSTQFSTTVVADAGRFRAGPVNVTVAVDFRSPATTTVRLRPQP
jgi:hypothetical protein